MVPAFRYVDGKLVPCANSGPRAYMMPPTSPRLLFPRKLTSRERRAEARKGTTGRRGARPVAKLERQIRYADMPQPVRLDGWPFADGRGREVLLYLPAGEKPTEAHARDLARAMRAA